MPKWLDELEAQPEEDPRKKYVLAALIGVVVLFGVWRLGPGSHPDPVPPPSGDVYRAAVPEVARAVYEGGNLELTVDKRWNLLDRGERTDRIFTLLEQTGSYEFARMRISDTDGDLVASVDADGSITWVEGPP